MPLLDPTWVAANAPSANVAASATRAAVTGKAHICQTIHCTFNATAAAPTAAGVAVALRDGATGVGSIIWSSQMSLPNTAGQSSPPIEIAGLVIAGTTGNAMTLEFTVAGGANTIQTVAFTGFDT